MFYLPVGQWMSMAGTGLCLTSAGIPPALEKLLQLRLENGLNRGADMQANSTLYRVITNLVGQ